MTNTFWISLAVAGLACAAALVAQSARNRDLERKIAQESAEIARLEDDLGRLGSVSPAAGGTDRAGEGSQAGTTSDERVARTRAQLYLLADEIGDVSASPGSLFLVLPDLLRVVQDLSLDELMEIAEGIEGTPSPEAVRTDARAWMRMVLFLLAAEQDPLRVMANGELMQDAETAAALLGTLARRDPEAARRWMKDNDMAGSSMSRIENMLVYQTLRRDVPAGLSLLREAQGHGGARLRQIPVPSEKMPELVAAMRDPANTDLKPTILGMVINSAMGGGGVAAARAQVEKLGIDAADLAAYFGQGQLPTMKSEPEATLQWAAEILPAEIRAKAIPAAVSQWSQRDYNAAGEWLGQLEPSPLKDGSIKAFCNTVMEIDPLAAVVWAAEIADRTVRQEVLGSAFERWYVSDRPAAEYWLSENSLTVEDVLSAVAAPAPR